MVIKQVEDELLLVNTSMETAQTIHAATSTELQNALVEIVTHFKTIKVEL